jgi:TolB-like protein
MKGVHMRFLRFLLLIFLSINLVFPSLSLTQTKGPGKAYKVAILPFLIHSQENLDYLREGVYDILASRIVVEGRIEVIDHSLVERALFEERPMRLDEAAATKIGVRAGADYVVLGSLTKVGDYISLDARMISIREEKPPLTAFTHHRGIEDVMVKIADFAQEIGYKLLGRRPVVGRSEESGHPYFIQPNREIGRLGSESPGFKKTETFGFEIKGLDIGDVDGDKKNEIVVMDKNTVYVFKYDGERMSLFQKIETGYHNNFLTLDVADVNRNGYAEIIVTSVVNDNLRSFILEFEKGKFRKIVENAGWYFRVLEHPMKGPMLMGQQMGSEGTYVGSIHEFVWKNDSFQKGPKLPLPRETNIFGFTLRQVRGEAKPDIIRLDESDRLNLLSEDGKLLWRSGGKFGGTNNSYDTSKKPMPGFMPNEVPFRVYIPGRILTRDLDGDGNAEVIVNKNNSATGTLFERIRSYEKGEIHSLVWDQETLMTDWKTREINGYIADYQVRDADNDGVEELVVATVIPTEGVTGIFSRKSRSNVLFFRLF